MSKRVPVYLNQEELRTLLQALHELHLKGAVTSTSEALRDRLNEELERNKEG